MSSPRKPTDRSAAARDDAPKIAILGLGQMGLVCSSLLASAERPLLSVNGSPAPVSPIRKPVRIVMWGHNSDEAGTLAQTRKTARLAGFTLPDDVRIAPTDEDALRDARLIVCAIPVQHIRSVFERLAPAIAPDVPVLSVAKGVEIGTQLTPTRVIADTLRRTGRDNPDRRPRRLGCLSGPTIATELARCLPAAMVAASDDPAFAHQIQILFGTSWLRIYTNADVLGVELAGAIKNVIAIAAGILDGLQAGNNAKSMLLARGLAEIVRLGSAMGCNPETFFGVAGLGDLATTCFSPEGRNRSCGEALGRGQKLDQYLAQTPFVVEGVGTCKAVMELATKYRVEMPITAAVHAVLFEDLDPIEAIGLLMSREQKAERIG